MRQIVLDTETTGLEVSQGHRIIEIGCVELIDRRITGNNWHFYINPDRQIDSGAYEVHGISNEFLNDKPRFAELSEDFLSYIKGAELVIHNAAFDVGFLDHGLSKLASSTAAIAASCTVLDTLLLARRKHPGQKNNLDALCRRYEIDNSSRSLHGALLDARILAEVYLLMTGGQTSLGLDASQLSISEKNRAASQSKKDFSDQPLPIWHPDSAALQADDEYRSFLSTQHADPAWK